MFYQANKKAFFIPSLITALCKRIGVPFFDVDDIIPMDIPIHPILVCAGSNSTERVGTEGLVVVEWPRVLTARIHFLVHG